MQLRSSKIIQNIPVIPKYKIAYSDGLYKGNIMNIMLYNVLVISITATILIVGILTYIIVYAIKK